jgi:hypothetical protein
MADGRSPTWSGDRFGGIVGRIDSCAASSLVSPPGPGGRQPDKKEQIAAPCDLEPSHPLQCKGLVIMSFMTVGPVPLVRRARARVHVPGLAVLARCNCAGAGARSPSAAPCAFVGWHWQLVCPFFFGDLQLPRSLLYVHVLQYTPLHPTGPRSNQSPRIRGAIKPLSRLTAESHTGHQLRCFSRHRKALFSSKKFCKTGTVALSFVCEKYCPIMN